MNISATITWAELLFTLLALSGLIVEGFALVDGRRTRDDVFAYAASLEQPLTRAVRNQFEFVVVMHERGVVVKLVFVALGCVNMLRVNPEYTPTMWISVMIMFALVLYLDITSFRIHRKTMRADVDERVRMHQVRDDEAIKYGRRSTD